MIPTLIPRRGLAILLWEDGEITCHESVEAALSVMNEVAWYQLSIADLTTALGANHA